MTRKQYFLSGLKDGMPICFGYFAVSFAFGIQAAGIGLSVFEASVLSALNVTSAGQFAALAIIASGASLIELAFTHGLTAVMGVHLIRTAVTERRSRACGIFSCRVRSRKSSRRACPLATVSASPTA